MVPPDVRHRKINLQVANCTTPANFFHVLRRQIHRNFRKPLIVISPKNLLRHKLAVSKIEDMGPGSSFIPVIPEVKEDILKSNKVRRLIFCSGKIYYDLFQAREMQKITDIAIVRIEELVPFPIEDIIEQVKNYPNAEIYW